jgi:predicted Rossmann-fold nucleotide-binding protein
MEKNIINGFKEKENIEHIIGFCGSSDNSNKELVEQIIQDSMIYFRNKDIAILTGGTCFGAVKVANEIAKDYGLKTIGIVPQRGEKYLLPALDLKVSIPSRYGNSEFGDESEVFVKACDALEIIGGSTGTAIEFYHALKINERRLNPKYNEKPIIIAPLANVEGFSKTIYSLPQIKNMTNAIPNSPIMYGGDAAKFILYKLEV